MKQKRYLLEKRKINKKGPIILHFFCTHVFEKEFCSKRISRAFYQAFSKIIIEPETFYFKRHYELNWGGGRWVM